MDIDEFGEFLTNLRKKNHGSRQSMSEKWPFHMNTIRSYESESRIPPIDYLAALAMDAEYSFNALLKMRLELSHVSGLDFDYLFRGSNDNNSLDYNELAHVIDDDSMSPTILKGSSVSYESETNLQSLVDGAVVLVEINTHIVARRVQFNFDGSIVLNCDNPNYKPVKIFKPDLKSLNVVGVIKATTNKL
jgi:transcriptional regulator with XRE-family HTH domain